MARFTSKHTHPHAVPRRRPVSFAPGGAQIWERTDDGRRMPVRSRLASLLIPAVFLGLSVAGCGRTDVMLPDESAAEQMDYAVEVERDVELDDASVVHVELVSPAPPSARSGLMGISNGVPVEDVIAAVCPDGSPIVELDATGEIPAIVIYMDDELRAVIWM